MSYKALKTTKNILSGGSFNPPEFKSHIAYGIVVLEMVALTIIGAASLECFAFLRWLCK